MNKYEKVITGLVIAFAILVIMNMLVIRAPNAHGYEYKNMTITIAKNSLFYCYLGNPDKGNVVCDSVDMDNRQWKEFDDFIEAFVNDRVERSYKVEVP